MQGENPKLAEQIVQQNYEKCSWTSVRQRQQKCNDEIIHVVLSCV